MAAFVTGAAGFIGLAVTEALLTRGERVIGFDLFPVSEHAERTFAGFTRKCGGKAIPTPAASVERLGRDPFAGSAMIAPVETSE